MRRYDVSTGLRYFSLSVAFVLPLYTGFGWMTLDQLADFLAALRLVDGQIPYKDFYAPYGPLGFLALFPFLALCPTPGLGVLLASATLNFAAATTTMVVSRGLGLDGMRVALATLLAAIWFLPPFGSYFHDHLAYLLLLVGLVLALQQRPGFAAVLVALAFHSKQTVGIIGVVTLAVSYWVCPRLRPRPRGKLLGTLFVFALTHAVVLALIALVADFSLYRDTTFVFPFSYIQFKADKNPLLWATGLLFPFGFSLFDLPSFGWGRLAFLPVVLGVYLIYFGASKLRDSARFAVVFTLLSTLWCGVFLSRSFTHVFLGLPIAFAGSSSLLPRKWANLFLIFFSILGAAQVAYLHPPSQATFRETRTTRLSPLTPPPWFAQSEAEEISRFLTEKGASYALLGQATTLIPVYTPYSAVSQPAFYFDGLITPWDDALRLKWEKRFVNVLTRLKPKYLVQSLLLGAPPGALKDAVAKYCRVELLKTELEILKCTF